MPDGSVIDAVVVGRALRTGLATRPPAQHHSEEYVVSEVRIVAEPRSEFGKGAARRVRRAHKVPAVIYGHGTPPRHVSLPGHELMLALKNANVLLALDLDGTTELTLPKAVQRDPVKGFLEHVDLVVVRRGERVTVSVPIQLTGEAVRDGLVTHELTALEVSAPATAIPAELTLDLEGLPIGGTRRAGDVPLPEGVELVTPADHPVVHVVAAPTAEQVAAEMAGAEAEVGIEREEPAAPSPAAAES